MRRSWMLPIFAVTAATFLTTQWIYSRSVAGFLETLMHALSGGVYDTKPVEASSADTTDDAQIPFTNMKVINASPDGRTRYTMGPRGDDVVFFIGVCDSVDVNAVVTEGELDLAFRSPSGRRITPSKTMSRKGEVFGRLIRPEPGEWTAKVRNSTSDANIFDRIVRAFAGKRKTPDQPVRKPNARAGFLLTREHGGTDVGVSFVPRHPRPRSRVTIQVTPRRYGNLVANADISAVYSRTSAHRQRLRLVDDGTAGDTSAGDGTFTTNATLDVKGEYELEIWVREKVAGGESVLTRYARVNFWVRG